LQVKFATDVETQTHYAVKIFSREKMSRDLQREIKEEIAIIKHVRHPHVVNLCEARLACVLRALRPLRHHASQVLASKTHVYIVLELVTGGELFDRIVTSGA